MNYEQLAREHHHAEVNLMRDVRVLVSAAHHVLNDKDSELHPLAKRILQDAMQRITETFGQ